MATETAAVDLLFPLESSWTGRHGSLTVVSRNYNITVRLCMSTLLTAFTVLVNKEQKRRNSKKTSEKISRRRCEVFLSLFLSRSHHSRLPNSVANLHSEANQPSCYAPLPTMHLKDPLYCTATTFLPGTFPSLRTLVNQKPLYQQEAAPRCLNTVLHAVCPALPPNAIS